LISGGNVDEQGMEAKKAMLAEDVKLVAAECPNLRNIQLYLFGETAYLEETDDAVWAPFLALNNLRQLNLIAHQWSESVALMRTVGSKLKSFYLSLDGRGTVWENGPGHPDQQIPKFEEIMSLCPGIETLTLSFGVKTTQVHSDSLHDSLKFDLLKELFVHTYMTKRAFTYLWCRTPNLTKFKVSSLVMNDEFPHDSRVEFDEAEMMRLLRANPMSRLERLDASLTVKNIATAKMLIEALATTAARPEMKGKTVEVRTVNIRVGLPQDEYPDQENMLMDLAQIMQSMRLFKMYCKEKAKIGLVVAWKWDRFGFLESFAEVHELNALIEPNG
jgi:hypothetical protein